jgi:hypothetical protein
MRTNTPNDQESLFSLYIRLVMASGAIHFCAHATRPQLLTLVKTWLQVQTDRKRKRTTGPTLDLVVA